MRVIVTGGTGVVGQALCRELASRGARVGFTFHRAEGAARELAEGIGGEAARLDLTLADSIGPALSELSERLGGLDAFVHCAGLASVCEPPRADRLEDLTSEGWDRLMAVNLKGAAFACRALAEPLARAQGNVVLVGSVAGVKTVPTPVAYTASKAALGGLAMALAKELGPAGVRVNVVAPGLLDAGTGRALPESLREDYLLHTALRRYAEPAEVARTIAWFALSNTYVTGRTVVVDGGL